MDHPLRAVPDQSMVGHEVVEAPRSFEEFFVHQHARLYGALSLVTGNATEAEEIMQDAFLRLWERWDRVAGLEDPTGYLFRTAMNVFRSRYRRTVRGMKRTIDPMPPEDALATVEDRDVVVRALRGLSANQRAAVLLTGYVGLTSEEAGRILGMKAGTVRTLAARARTEIREEAEEAGEAR
ncbi:MAG TPA: sigma-70 family RNA polymerase sigma factor [Actinomycetota bacterium]|nr:sigma-70 family RNA polymerase sigma factor [Actinomycetota bacterium]